MIASGRYLLNETPGDEFLGYDAETSALKPSRHFVQAQGDTPEEAAEFVYSWFNRDDRDNGREERSCSAGDVIQLAVRVYPSAGLPFWRMHFFAVEPVGFREVSRTLVVESIEKAGFSAKEAFKATETLYAPTRSETTTA